MIHSLKVHGYVVRFCTDHHDPRHRCTNDPNRRYYVSKDDANRYMTKEILKKANLVFGHENNKVIGSITDVYHTEKGVILCGVVDDYHLLKSLRNQYVAYGKIKSKEKISYTDYVKKCISGYSMSHNPKNWHINHVGLVNTTGRMGTSVSYYIESNIPLKTRENNKDIGDILSAHCNAYLTCEKRREYLKRSTEYSLHPHDNAYINASYDIMSADPSVVDMFAAAFQKGLSEAMTKQQQQQAASLQDLLARYSTKRKHQQETVKTHEQQEPVKKKFKTDDDMDSFISQISQTDARMSKQEEKVDKLHSKVDDIYEMLSTFTNKKSSPPPPLPKKEEAVVEASRDLAPTLVDMLMKKYRNYE